MLWSMGAAQSQDRGSVTADSSVPVPAAPIEDSSPPDEGRSVPAASPEVRPLAWGGVVPADSGGSSTSLVNSGACDSGGGVGASSSGGGGDGLACQCGDRSHRCGRTSATVDDGLTVVALDTDAGETPRNRDGECIICLNDLGDDQPLKTLSCQHTFHEPCIEEWLDKDGRCPICRHQIRQPTRPPASGLIQDLEADGFGGAGGLRSLATSAALVLESRRLMMLSTMEAALAVLVMSYMFDVIAPALMLLAACTTFGGASNYHARLLSAARPFLALSALYHIYIVGLVVHGQDGECRTPRARQAMGEGRPRAPRPPSCDRRIASFARPRGERWVREGAASSPHPGGRAALAPGVHRRPPTSLGATSVRVRSHHARVRRLSTAGTPFFSEAWGAARMVLFSMFCITFMEVTMLKKCVAFHHLLMQTSPIELRALRIHRRAHTGWAHRLVIGIMFIVICAPVIARYMCRTEAGDDSELARSC